MIPHTDTDSANEQFDPAFGGEAAPMTADAVRDADGSIQTAPEAALVVELHVGGGDLVDEHGETTDGPDLRGFC